MSALRVAYRDNPEVGFHVNLIRSWRRGEIEMDMSTSSGPKDQIGNRVCTIFDQMPRADRVLMVRGEYKGSVPFLLVVAGGQVFDMAGKAVAFQKQLLEE